MVFRVVAANGIDTKQARVGDKVKMRILAAETLDDGSVIEAGSRLEGRVLVATPYSSSTNESRLEIRIDRLRWKKQWIPINGFIIAQGEIRGMQNSPSMYGIAHPVYKSPVLHDVELQEIGKPTHSSWFISNKKDIVIEAGMGFLIRNSTKR